MVIKLCSECRYYTTCYKTKFNSWGCKFFKLFEKIKKKAEG